jgi:16S rRNA (uracil1498-N3)-methyltransferase
VSLRPYVHVDASLGERCAGDRVPLSDAERHHLGRVLRLTDGARVEVADGTGWSAPATLTGEELALTADPEAAPPPRPALALAQALPKARKLDEVVRTATELGVDRLWPLATSRSVVRLDAARTARAVERWEAVVRAAAEQARRPSRPHVHPPIGLEDLPGAAAVPAGGVLLVAHPGAASLAGVLTAAWRDAPVVAVAVGPEGGFTADEVAQLVGAGALAVGLGPTVLRTEHAGAAALAVLAGGLGRWDTHAVRSARRPLHPA